MAGCNLRCPFCHNSALAEADSGGVSEEAFFAFLEKRAGILDGVCVTGGEPAMQPDIKNFLERVKKMGYAVKLDTNGCFPDMLGAVVEQGLVDYVAMDLKSAPAGYAAAAGMHAFDIGSVRESITFLLNGPVDYEFRTTVVRQLHDAQVLRDAAHLIKGAKRYYLQKFVDPGDLAAGGLSACSDEEMKRILNVVSPYVQMAALRGV